MHRALVADDHARMRRGVRARPVRPDDGIARKHPAPPVVATHVDALPGADLRQRPARQRRSQGPKSGPARRWSCGWSWRPRSCLAVLSESSRQTRFRFSRWAVPKRQLAPDIIFQIQYLTENSPDFPAISCKIIGSPSREGAPERWPSGLRRTLGKRVCGKPYRGFESHSLRHTGRKVVIVQRFLKLPVWQPISRLSFHMRLDLGVDERCAVLACRSVHPGDLNARRAHQVEDISSITKKVIGDKPSVTTPPNGF